MNIQAKHSYHRKFIVILLCIALFRLIASIYSPLNLHGDEAQYWSWSRSFDWGYFSKPPMIAWVIGITTSIFGNEEWAVRLSTHIIHPITAYIIYRTAQFMYGARTGFWAGLIYFLMPAVWLSSGLVSTDVALLLFWAIALNAFVHLRETPNMKWALLLGLGIGFGMLSKYAMMFFLIGGALSIIFDSQTRRTIFSRYGIISMLIALIILSPNIVWNAANDFATMEHTIANANIQEKKIHPGELVEFITSQFGVFGPLTFLILLVACFSTLRAKGSNTARLLVFFTLVPLVIITIEALLSRANANWAVSAFISGSILTAHYGLRFQERWLRGGVLINTFVGFILVVLVLAPNLANSLGAGNTFKRLRGWPETETAIKNLAAHGHDGKSFGAIAVDNRLVFFDLLYYGIEEDTQMPLRMWLHTAHISHHAEATAPLLASKINDAPVLLVSYYHNYERDYIEDFKRLEALPPIRIELGGGKVRHLKAWAGYGYTPTIDPNRKSDD